MGRTKVNKEVKIQACKDYDNGKESFKSIALMIGVSSITVMKGYYIYKQHGEITFETSSKNKSYWKAIFSYFGAGNPTNKNSI